LLLLLLALGLLAVCDEAKLPELNLLLMLRLLLLTMVAAVVCVAYRRIIKCKKLQLQFMWKI